MKKFWKDFWRGAAIAIPAFIIMAIGIFPIYAIGLDGVNDWLALFGLVTVPAAMGVASAVGDVISDRMKAKENK